MTIPNTQGQQVPQDGNTDTGNNGVWGELLGVIPPELHEQVTPVLRKWEQGANGRFQELHSQYDPYKDLVQNYSPEDLSAAVGMVQNLQQNPQGFYDTLVEAADQLGITVEQAIQEMNNNGDQPVNQQVNTDPQNDPYGERFTALESAIGTLAETLLQSQQMSDQAAEDAELESVMSGLHKQFGEFDDDYVLTKIAAGIDPKDAVEAYFGVTGRNPAADSVPPILGSGGGLPSNREQIAKMGKSDTENLVASLLEQANKQ